MTDEEIATARANTPPDLHEVLGLIPYLGHDTSRTKNRPPEVQRTPHTWFGRDHRTDEKGEWG